MRERDWGTIRARRAEVEAAEAAEREARERPIREATQKLEQTYRELNEVNKERLIGKVPDPDRFIDHSVGPDVRMSPKQAQDFNLKQWNLFTAAHPEIYVCQELLDLLDAYCEKEGIRIVTFSMIEHQVQRLADCGLLPERPAPEPEPAPNTEVEDVPVDAGPQMFDGWDDDGLQKQFTSRQVARMSSSEYRRAFQVTRESLRPPVWGPGRGLR